MVTRKEVAAAAGVSEAVVSYVINGRTNVKEQTRRKVLEAMDRMGYRPNMLARSLKMRKTQQIAVLVNYLGNPFEAGILLHLENAAREYGYVVFFQTYEQALEKQLISLLYGRVDGIVVMGQTLHEETIAHFESLKLPILSVARPAVWDRNIPYIDLDWTVEYRKAIRHLLDKGHKRIGYLTHENPLHYHNHRYRCFVRAMEAEGTGLLPSDIVHANGTAEHAQRVMVARMNASDGRPPFSSVVCANDLMAIGAISAIKEVGFQPGKHMAVAGSEDILMASHTDPDLSAIHYPREQLGQLGFRKMLELLQGERFESVILQGEWKARGSA